MAQQGHAPSNGPANALYLLGLGLCPECRGDLQPSGNSSYTCPQCGDTYPVAGGVP